MTLNQPPSPPSFMQRANRAGRKHGKRPTGPRGYVVPDSATINGVTLDKFIENQNGAFIEGFKEFDKATAQKIIMPIPKGDLTLLEPDGRVLRREVGGDESRLKGLFIKNNWGEVTLVRCWHHGPTDFLVMATIDNAAEHGELLHISLSYKDHDPSWEEIKTVRSTFFPPFTDVMMMLPDEAYYVNISPHCFHLWQCPSPWNIG